MLNVQEVAEINNITSCKKKVEEVDHTGHIFLTDAAFSKSPYWIWEVLYAPYTPGGTLLFICRAHLACRYALHWKCSPDWRRNALHQCTFFCWIKWDQRWIFFQLLFPLQCETGNVTSPEFQVQTEQTTSHFIYLLNSIYMIGSLLLFLHKDIWPEVYWLNFWLGAACWIFFGKASGVVYLRWSDVLPSDRGGWAESRNPGPGGWLVQYSIDVWCWPYSCMSLAHAERSKCLFGGLHALTHFNVSFHSQHTITKPPRSRGSEQPFWLWEWLN